MRQKPVYLCKGDVFMRILFICLGNMVLGFGNAICLQTGLGADPLNILYYGTAASLQIPEGTASLLVAGVMIAITLVLDRSQIGIGTILSPFLFSVGIDWGMAVIPTCTWFPTNYAVMLTGLCAIAFGIAMSIYANFGKSSNDALIFGIMSRTKLEYYKIRWGLDLLYLLVGILLGGKMTPATVIAVIVLGKIITYFVHLLKKTNLIKD